MTELAGFVAHLCQLFETQITLLADVEITPLIEDATGPWVVDVVIQRADTT